MLSPLDKICTNKDSKEKISWTDDLEAKFAAAKDHLKQAKTLTLPQYSDKLQLITDAASVSAGLGATIYLIKDNKAHLAGLFNARKTSTQAGWLACELEALGIVAVVKYFSLYTVQPMY